MQTPLPVGLALNPQAICFYLQHRSRSEENMGFSFKFLWMPDVPRLCSGFIDIFAYLILRDSDLHPSWGYVLCSVNRSYLWRKKYIDIDNTIGIDT